MCVYNMVKVCLLGSWAPVNIIRKEANIDRSEIFSHSLNENEWYFQQQILLTESTIGSTNKSCETFFCY